MFAACINSHLEVANWLFEVGAADDIHINVAKWLFEVGASAVIHTKDNDGATPMWVICGHLLVALWLLLDGTANGDDGHVNRNVLYGDVPTIDLPSAPPSCTWSLRTPLLRSPFSLR